MQLVVSFGILLLQFQILALKLLPVSALLPKVFLKDFSLNMDVRQTKTDVH